MQKASYVHNPTALYDYQAKDIQSVLRGKELEHAQVSPQFNDRSYWSNRTWYRLGHSASISLVRISSKGRKLLVYYQLGLSDQWHRWLNNGTHIQIFSPSIQCIPGKGSYSSILNWVAIDLMTMYHLKKWKFYNGGEAPHLDITW